MTNEFVPGLVAVVGRPNVGKSTLFNRLVKERVSIVQDTPGVTRDRIYRTTEHWGVPFVLCDTGGFEPKTDDPILAGMRRQTQLAIEQADAVIFSDRWRLGADGRRPRRGGSAAPCRRARFSGGQQMRGAVSSAEAWEFTQLGLGDLHIISAEHGVGISDLMDDVVAVLPAPEVVEEDPDERERVEALLDELEETIAEYAEDAQEGDEEAEIVVSEALDEQNRLRFDRRYPKPDTIRLAVIGKPNAARARWSIPSLGRTGFWSRTWRARRGRGRCAVRA